MKIYLRPSMSGFVTSIDRSNRPKQAEHNLWRDVGRPLYNHPLTWSRESWVEELLAIRRSEHDNIRVSTEAVHLHEQLVQRIIPLIITAHLI